MKQTMVSRRVKWGVGVLVFCLMAVGIWPKQLASQELSHVLPTQLPPVHPNFPNETEDFLNYISAPQPAPYVRLSAQTITPMPAVQAMMDQVTKAKLRNLVGDLSGEWPVLIGGVPYTIATRNTDSGEPINKATQYAFEHMQASGISTQYYPWTISFRAGSWYFYSNRNVIGEIKGKTRPNEIYIISAHLDDAPYHSSIAPGADDNASGSAAVLIAAQIMSQYEWNCTLRFALWTGEEQGTLGSKYYAGMADAAKENIQGVINLDMIGWNSIPSPNVNIQVASQISGSIPLAQMFADVVSAYGINLLPEIIVMDSGFGYYNSDYREFWYKNYSAIGIEEESLYDFNSNYHQDTDRLRYLDLNYLENNVKAAVGTLAHTSGCLASQTPMPTMTPTSVGQPTATPTSTPLPQNPYSIRGKVWNDGNGDGLISGTMDSMILGVTVTLQTTTSQFLGETHSALDGYYSFINLPAGNYQIVFAVPASYTFTQQNVGGSGWSAKNSIPDPISGLASPISIPNGSYYVNAGYVSLTSPTPTPTPIPGDSISGHMWLDGNTLGYRDMYNATQPGDIGAPLLPVALMSPDGNVLQVTQTANDGSYSFKGLVSGTYVISFTTHPGYAFTIRPGSPSPSGWEQSMADPATGATDPITVTSDVTVGAGLVRLPTTTKWLPFGYFLPNTIRDTSANW